MTTQLLSHSAFNDLKFCILNLLPMPVIIHKALYERLTRHPEWKAFRRSFETLSRKPVRLLEEKPGKEPGCLAVDIELHGVYVGSLAVIGSAEGPEMQRAWRHLLELAADRFAAILSASGFHERDPLPTVIIKVCRWIRAHALGQEIRLREAAAQSGLSPSHLSRLFHKSTGMTFQEYVTRYRLEHACHLLTTTQRPVTEIAFESGFQSISQFNRSFKKVCKERPVEYRRRRGKKG